jgi:RNA polymerase sigma-70 factor (ECF subfamily)
MEMSAVHPRLISATRDSPDQASARPVASTTMAASRGAAVEPTGTDLTPLLRQATGGDAEAQDLLLHLLVPRLRVIAAAQMARERPGHTLSPTALVNEAFLRLARQEALPDKNVEQFLAIFATTMRRVLVDRWKKKHAAKHGGGWIREPLDDLFPGPERAEDEALAVHECLERLEREQPRQAKLVELRFFGGLSNAEIAEHLGVSLSTVEADWRFARAWLRLELEHRR